MGVKTVITLEEFQTIYPCKSLTPSLHGAKDSVYFVDNDSVLKIYEQGDRSTCHDEVTLLTHLDMVCVPHVKALLTIQGKPALVLSRCHGEHMSLVTHHHIAQIAHFLRQFHHLTASLVLESEGRYEPNSLEKLIEQSGEQIFFDYFYTLSCPFERHGVIHGDLFVDNTLFGDNCLSGVFDFSHTSIGDYRFDLGVIALSWCFEHHKLNPDKVKTLLKNYGFLGDYNDFLPYIAYAGLYFSVIRYNDNRDYHDLLKKIGDIV